MPGKLVGLLNPAFGHSLHEELNPALSAFPVSSMSSTEPAVGQHVEAETEDHECNMYVHKDICIYISVSTDSKTDGDNDSTCQLRSNSVTACICTLLSFTITT
jgi:hypothetical protein